MIWGATLLNIGIVLDQFLMAINMHLTKTNFCIWLNVLLYVKIIHCEISTYQNRAVFQHKLLFSWQNSGTSCYIHVAELFITLIFMFYSWHKWVLLEISGHCHNHEQYMCWEANREGKIYLCRRVCVPLTRVRQASPSGGEDRLGFYP
jgi:hypothetical protein